MFICALVLDLGISLYLSERPCGVFLICLGGDFMVAPAVDAIVGYLVRDGVKYLLKKVVNGVVDGVETFVWQIFADEDGDQLPDDPENPLETYDEEPEDWFPFDDHTSDEPGTTIGDVIIITPEGVVIQSDDLTTSDIQQQYEKAEDVWRSYYGALDKPFKNYSVTEGLLFLIFIVAGFSLFTRIFHRRNYL